MRLQQKRLKNILTKKKKKKLLPTKLSEMKTYDSGRLKLSLLNIRKNKYKKMYKAQTRELDKQAQLDKIQSRWEMKAKEKITRTNCWRHRRSNKALYK